MLEKLFQLKEHKTDVKTEVLAGITTFMTMAYILAVNPSILSATGMPYDAVFAATALSAALGTLIMGLYANYPFALAPGMGLNAFFAFTVVLGMGLSWQAALAAVFISGVVFLLLTLTSIREAIINSIPMSLKLAVGVGIGFFIAFIGLKNAGIIVSNPATYLSLISIENFNDPAFKEANPFITPRSVLLTVIGLVLTSVLVLKKVRGALLWGILATTILGIPMGVTNVSDFQLVKAPPSLGETFLAFDFKELFNAGFLTIIFAFLFVDIFDSIGTFIGVSSKAGLLDKDGKLPRANKALMADSVATMAGAALGTSTVTTYVESAAGVAEGGRTGLTAVTAAVLFALALFFSPLFAMIPGAATAPILIIVGVFMMEPIVKINFSDFLDAIPAFLTIVMMPFAFSIAEGIVFGVISYSILRLLVGKAKEVSPMMWILTALFIVKFVVDFI